MLAHAVSELNAQKCVKRCLIIHMFKTNSNPCKANEYITVTDTMMYLNETVTDTTEDCYRSRFLYFVDKLDIVHLSYLSQFHHGRQKRTYRKCRRSCDQCRWSME